MNPVRFQCNEWHPLRNLWVAIWVAVEVLPISEDQRGDLLGGFRLQRRDDVRIQIKRDTDARVPQAVRNCLGVNAGEQRKTGVTVPQAMNTDRWKSQLGRHSTTAIRPNCPLTPKTPATTPTSSVSSSTTKKPTKRYTSRLRTASSAGRAPTPAAREDRVAKDACHRSPSSSMSKHGDWRPERPINHPTVCDQRFPAKHDRPPRNRSGCSGVAGRTPDLQGARRAR